MIMEPSVASTNREREEEARIMDAITRREVRMRPRWYFVLRGVLLIAAVLLLFLLLLYLVSFIIFALHENGAWFAPHFGLSGWSLLVTAVPWSLLLLAFAFIVILASLLMRYEFVYHRPLLYFLFSAILVVTVGGFLIASTSLQPGLLPYEAATPVLGGFYRYETSYPSNVHRGTIVALAGDGTFVIADDLGATSTVAPATGVMFADPLHAGDVVLVFGASGEDGVIRAFGVETIASVSSSHAE